MAARKNRAVSEETRRKLSEAGKGRRPSEEARRNMSESAKHRSPEHLQKIAEANRGKHPSEETRRKMSEAKLGKHRPEEQRRKMATVYCGEKCHLWKGGVSFEPYCHKFNNEFKERVRAFFGYVCQVCGHVWQPGEHKLAVHHVKYNKMVCCDGSKPLFVPLCAYGCHHKTNFNREFWEEAFYNLIMLEHDGECYLSKPD